MKKLQQAIKEGFNILREEKGYRSVEILKKFKTLDTKISPASFSKIINNREVGQETLKKAYKGITGIISSELGLYYNQDSNCFVRKGENKSWIPEIIPLPSPHKTTLSIGITFHDKGRLPIYDKVVFMQQAKKEVIEFGVRLRTFVDYFNSRSEFEFARPVKQLLEKGVNFKLYLLDPTSNEALLYFNDRAKALETEGNSIEVLKEVIRNLEKLSKSIKEMGLPGKLEIFTYKHIPYNHFFLVDGATRHGKIMVSNYLYGIKRADCPVIELSKQTNYDLFKRYYSSFKSLIKDAKKIAYP